MGRSFTAEDRRKGQATKRENQKMSLPACLPRAKAIRAKCLDCSGTAKMVKYCTLDGHNSTRCELWPYRFGISPAAAVRRYGIEFMDPELMPDANVCLDDLDQ